MDSREHLALGLWLSSCYLQIKNDIGVQFHLSHQQILQIFVSFFTFHRVHPHSSRRIREQIERAKIGQFSRWGQNEKKTIFDEEVQWKGGEGEGGGFLISLNFEKRVHISQVFNDSFRPLRI